MNRRAFCGSLALGGLLALSPANADAPLTVTDMAGRTLRLQAPPSRIVLLEARDILTMALLHPDPASLVVGWAAEARIDSPDLKAGYAEGHDIEVVGLMAPDSVSIEGLVSLAPDLVVANYYMAPAGSRDPLVTRLESFGIPVIFSDTSSNTMSGEPQDGGPAAVVGRQIRMWGDLLGKAEKAREFADFFDTRLARVASCIKGVPPVTTYLEIQSTVEDCCWAAGTRVWGELLALAGGQTLPGVTAPWFQQLQLEYLLAEPHDVYIASGGGFAAGSRPAIGPGMDPDEGRRGLMRLTERTGFGGLSSVRNRRVHGIWTGLIAVPPLNVLFVECAAKWLHPERCVRIDPAATLAELNARFFNRPIEGPLWISL